MIVDCIGDVKERKTQHSYKPNPSENRQKSNTDCSVELCLLKDSKLYLTRGAIEKDTSFLLAFLLL